MHKNWDELQTQTSYREEGASPNDTSLHISQLGSLIAGRSAERLSLPEPGTGWYRVLPTVSPIVVLPGRLGLSLLALACLFLCFSGGRFFP